MRFDTLTKRQAKKKKKSINSLTPAVWAQLTLAIRQLAA